MVLQLPLVIGQNIMGYTDEQEAAFKLIFSDPQQARVKIDALLAQQVGKDALCRSLSYNLSGIQWSTINQLDSALHAFNQSLLDLSDTIPQKPYIIKNRALALQQLNKREAAITELEEALQLTIRYQPNNRNLHVVILGALASAYSISGYNHRAVSFLIEALSLVENSPDFQEIDVAIQKQKLANAYLQTNSHVFARKLFDEILPIFEKHGQWSNYYLTLVNLSEALLFLNLPFEALETAKKGYTGLLPLGNPQLLVFAESRVAKLQAFTGDTIGAQQTFDNAFTNALACKSIHTMVIVYDYWKYSNQVENSAAVLAIHQRMEEAFEDLEQFPPFEVIGYFQVVADAFYSVGQTELAYNALNISRKTSEKLQETELKDLQLDLQAKYQNDLQASENLVLSQQVQLSRRNSFLMFTAVLVLLLTIGFQVVISKKRLEIKNVEAEGKHRENILLAQKLEAERENNLFKEQILSSQKKQMLVSLVEKERLRTLVDELLQTSKAQKLEQLKSELFSLGAKQIGCGHLASFYLLYPNFKSALEATYPKLSQNDIDFCLYVYLGFSFKEIGDILNITHQSVITRRYRLSKKMALDENQDLAEVVGELVKS